MVGTVILLRALFSRPYGAAVVGFIENGKEQIKLLARMRPGDTKRQFRVEARTVFISGANTSFEIISCSREILTFYLGLPLLTKPSHQSGFEQLRVASTSTSARPRGRTSLLA